MNKKKIRDDFKKFTEINLLILQNKSANGRALRHKHSCLWFRTFTRKDSIAKIVLQIKKTKTKPIEIQT